MNPFELAWTLWLLIWLLIWSWSKRSRRRESPGSRMLHVLPLLLGIMLISNWHHRGGDWHGGLLTHPVLPYLSWFYWLGLVLTYGGLAFAVWARLYLGSNWSATVQVKADHELVRSGPYRFVRHPIYTGMLSAFVGCALALDQWRGVLAVVIVVAGLVYKLRLEERWMAETFGEAYADYRRHTRALVPFLF